uniref:Uncharacterized protein n=1 Tax=Setaria italica TaxID=4555 RepID=K3Z1R7_SETIT
MGKRGMEKRARTLLGLHMQFQTLRLQVPGTMSFDLHTTLLLSLN